MGARYLTVEELDRRHEEARQKLLAKEAGYAEARRKREAKKASQNKLEMLGRFLDRHGLSLEGPGEADAAVQVYWHGAYIGDVA